MVIVEELGSNSEDKTNITIVSAKGKVIVGNDYKIGSSCASTSKYHFNSKDKKMNALFHIRVITKQTNIDTLIDIGKLFSFVS